MTGEQLKKFAERHLWYEIEMFFETISALASHEYENDSVIHNALLESFVIHGRNLDEFFMTDRKKHDDTVIAKDFFDDCNTWEKERKKLKKQERIFDRQKAHKAVAHLSTERLKYLGDAKKWNCTAIGKEFFEMLEIFLTLASTSKMSEKFRVDVRSFKNKLPFLADSAPRPSPSRFPISRATIPKTSSQTKVSTVTPKHVR